MSKIYKLKNSNEKYEVNNNLLNEFENMESRNGQKLSPYSCKSYSSKVNRISILMSNKPYEDYKYFVNNVDNIIKKVNESELKSKKDYFSAINKLLKSKMLMRLF
jgi:conjugal transfer/entry exclusion protein